MKISYSAFSTFMQNPERYRLRYGLRLRPVGEDTPSIFNYGRRRGSCVHAIHEARSKGLRDSEVTKYLFPQDMYERAVKMVEKIPHLDLLPNCNEVAFDCNLGDGEHQAIGRIDHAFREDGHIWIGDLKTTSAKTKKEMRKWFGELETSPQAHFYLYAAALLGFATDRIRYHCLIDNGPKEEPDYIPVDKIIGPSAVARKMAGVISAAKAIEFHIKTFGVEKPWAHSNQWPCNGDQAFCGFSSICERTLPKGCAPEGFVTKLSEGYETNE